MIRAHIGSMRCSDKYLSGLVLTFIPSFKGGISKCLILINLY